MTSAVLWRTIGLRKGLTFMQKSSHNIKAIKSFCQWKSDEKKQWIIDGRMHKALKAPVDMLQDKYRLGNKFGMQCGLQFCFITVIEHNKFYAQIYGPPSDIK